MNQNEFLNALAKALNANTTKRSAAKKKSKSKKRPVYASSEERKAAFATAAVAAAKERGFNDAVANENILTYGKWEAKGLRPKKGEKAIRVPTGRGAGLPLFHVSQCEPVVEATETVS